MVGARFGGFGRHFARKLSGELSAAARRIEAAGNPRPIDVKPGA
jgi:hypothetical protein